MYENLPYSNLLPVDKLAGCFKNVTTSYKFYWFLAIIEDIMANNNNIIYFDDIFSRIISNVWYPINYFNLNFGKLDKLSKLVKEFKDSSNLSINTKKEIVFKEILNFINTKSKLAEEIKKLGKFVPYRFIRPWFLNELKQLNLKDNEINSKIINLSHKSFENKDNLCMYRFLDDNSGIEIQKDWFLYIKKNIKILNDFCLFNLVNYLQNKNPNVPNIAGKLFEPMKRSLINAHKLWNLVTEENDILCIYSKEPISKGNFSIDHFIPWSFVTHDLLWNLIPTQKNINSKKSNNLPNLNIYFDDFAKLQKIAFNILYKYKKNKMLEDYVIIFNKEIPYIYNMEFMDFKSELFNIISPIMQIASNMGFNNDWKYIKL